MTFKKLFQVLLIIDVVLQMTQVFNRQSKMLHSLYVRGRHHMINTITDPPSILPVVDIDLFVVIIPVNDMLHCEVQVSTDVWSPSENPFLFLIMPPM